VDSCEHTDMTSVKNDLQTRDPVSQYHTKSGPMAQEEQLYIFYSTT